MATMRVGREAADRAGGGRDGAELVARTLARHHDALRATARRHSLCDDDACDAVQRALELFLRHAPRLDPERAHLWLFTVTKHEAFAVRAERQRLLPGGPPHDFDALEARHEPSPDDRLLELERVQRAGEALAHLKPAEAQALSLKAAGRSYDEIARDLGWTRTKVNRCLTEGRARLHARIAGIEAGEECARWAPLLGALHDGSAAAPDLIAARRHVRNCPGCRAEVRALHRPAGLLSVMPGGLIGVLVAVQERAVGGAVRAQAAVDALTTGKAAAVAASAAALAGGGVAAVDRALEPPSRAVQDQVRTAAAPSPTAPRAPRRAPDPRPATAPAPVAVSAPPIAVAPAATPAPRPTAPRTATVPMAPAGAGEFGPDGSAEPVRPPAVPRSRPAAAAAPRVAATERSADGGELLP